MMSIFLWLLFYLTATDATLAQDALTRPVSGAPTTRTAKTTDETGQNSVPRVSLPFFDSFLYSQNYADSTKWLPKQPALVSRNSAHRPPDYGTLLFDGLNAVRTVYSINNEQGAADSLCTGYIDLSEAKAHFNLFLTFYFQFAGKNDPPYAFTDTTFYVADSNAPKTYVVTRTVWDSVAVTDTVVRRDSIVLATEGPFEGRGQRNDTLVNPRTLPRNDTLEIRTYLAWEGPVEFLPFPEPDPFDTVSVGSFTAVRNFIYRDTSVVVFCDTVVKITVALDTIFENLDTLVVAAGTVYDTLWRCDTMAVVGRHYTGTFTRYFARKVSEERIVPAGEKQFTLRHTADDSLAVFFRSSDSTLRDPFVFVWSVNFENVEFRRDTFYRAVVPIDRSEFMHSRFQVMFRNYGTRSGPFDCWHLDYVGLDAGVKPMRAQKDVGISEVSRSPFPVPLTAVPQRHFADGAYPLGPWTATVSNLSDANYSTDGAYLSVFDPPNNTLWTQTPVALTSPAQTFTDVSVPPPATFYPPGYAGRLTYTLALPVSFEDPVPANNVLSEPYFIRDYLAYDDGEPEYGYGVESRNAFAQKYRFNRDDEISAVWMCFVHTPKIDSAAGKSFTLAIWKPDTFHPDSILYQKTNGVFTQYPPLDLGDGGVAFPYRYFYRYELDSAVKVQAGRDYFIGCIQRDADLLAVGFDLSHDNKENIVYSNNRSWQYGRFSGTLMIRPEFNSHQWSLVRTEKSVVRPKVYPNPVREGEKLYLAGLNGEIAFEWLDATGRIVSRGRTMDGVLDAPPAGFYLLRLVPGGTTRVSVVR